MSVGPPGSLSRLAVAGIRYDPGNPDRSDLDLDRREIHVRGEGGRDRTVRIDPEAARRVDRYLRVRARHEQAYRLGLWLGTGGRGPLTGNGIYQMVKRRGDQQACGCTRTGSGTTSAIPVWIAAGPRAT